MIEFDSFCYLQNQKTGGTYVETFLRSCASDDIVRYEKHMAPKLRKPGKFYFISVRDPLDTYLSLFNYGLDGKGEIFERFTKMGLARLYSHGLDGFEEWLMFLLDKENASLVFPVSGLHISQTIGLLTYRFLRLSCVRFDNFAAEIRSTQAIGEYFETHRLVDHVMHYEHMHSDLIKLIEGPLSGAFQNRQAALDWLKKSDRINASKRRDNREPLVLSEKCDQALRTREEWLYRTFYPEH